MEVDNAESLLKGVASRKINGSEYEKEYNNIVHDAGAVVRKSTITRIKKKMVKILSLLAEISSLKIKDQMKNHTLQICLN